MTRPLTLLMLALGFASGLPFLLTGVTLTARLVDAGTTTQTIGLFGLASLPYALKVVWAPLLQTGRVPGLARRFGSLRAWAMVWQGAIMACILVSALLSPQAQLGSIALLTLLLAFSSASLDIVLDAYRIRILPASQQAAGAATFVTGYRAAVLVAGSGAVLASVYFPWPVVYAVLAVIQGIGMLAVWKAPRDDEDDGTSLPSPALSGWFHTGVIAPLKPLLTLPNLAGLLALLLLYKLADGYLGSMTYKFLRETGFEKPDIVTTQQIVGLLATMAGGAFGGWIATKMPLARFLLLGGVLQMASNMVYYWLARQGAPDLSHLRIAVLVEETAGGIGTAAFMAFVAHLCHRSFAVTHYAFFTSLMALGRIVVSSSSGYAAVHLGWPLFFIASTFMAVPGLLLVVWMQPLLNRLARGAGRPPVLPAS